MSLRSRTSRCKLTRCVLREATSCKTRFRGTSIECLNLVISLDPSAIYAPAACAAFRPDHHMPGSARSPRAELIIHHDGGCRCVWCFDCEWTPLDPLLQPLSGARPVPKSWDPPILRMPPLDRETSRAGAAGSCSFVWDVHQSRAAIRQGYQLRRERASVRQSALCANFTLCNQPRETGIRVHLYKAYECEVVTERPTDLCKLWDVWMKSR
ncbi:hypothetical protein B0T17DRAFT_122123 [Bombardia bombarda]|uniref:Uncharacterized protein n=1 Tax=Bombardia bombarda TaxID=252184 RepID=A0AA39U4D8_9PEZI|nr:hypothetical protein B0T17DRAFT_122123 [Bombardia bombarda]